MNGYLDFETTGLDVESDTIISIQYQKLDFYTKAPIGELIILKSWETSEKDILKRFKKVLGTGDFDFVAYGFNLKFEAKFFTARCIANGIEPIDLNSRPSVDLHPVAILMNGGFKGSGLDKVTGKKGTGMLCLAYYEAGDYKRVERYIKQEAEAFCHFLVWLTSHMPKVLTEYRVDLL